jgi:tetratricopeptide (TPR) repeat protein
MEPDNLS